MKVSVVSPVFNDSLALPELIKRLFLEADIRHYQLELILVDDGSDNAVWDQEKLVIGRHLDRNITLIRLASNHGQGAATLCGLLHCTSDFVITMDGDLQHPPEAIHLLIQELTDRELELVYGTSMTGHSWIRRVCSRAYKVSARLLGVTFLNASAFRAMRRPLVDRLCSHITEKSLSVDDCLYEEVRHAGYVSIGHQRRMHGQSSYTWKKLLKSTIRISYYSKQLRKASIRLSGAMVVFACIYSLLNDSITSHIITAVIAAIAAITVSTCHFITIKRRSIRLADQFDVSETISLYKA